MHHPENEINLRFQRKNRHKPQPGDIFVMQLKSERYLFGRIINNDFEADPLGDLVYIYAHQSDTPDVDSSLLTKETLLLPPLLMNRLGFTRGYQTFVRNEPLVPGDTFDPGCFYDPTRGRYQGTDNRILAEPVRPIAVQTVRNYRAMDDGISEALGIEKAWYKGQPVERATDGSASGFGPLVIEEFGDEPEYCLSLKAGTTASDAVFEAEGYLPNGYMWHGVAESLVDMRLPLLEHRVDFDPEAGSFRAYSHDRQMLVALARLMSEIANDVDSAKSIITLSKTRGFDLSGS